MPWRGVRNEEEGRRIDGSTALEGERETTSSWLPATSITELQCESIKLAERFSFSLVQDKVTGNNHQCQRIISNTGKYFKQSPSKNSWAWGNCYSNRVRKKSVAAVKQSPFPHYQSLKSQKGISIANNLLVLKTCAWE